MDAIAFPFLFKKSLLLKSSKMKTVEIETSFSKCSSGHDVSIKICFVNEPLSKTTIS